MYKVCLFGGKDRTELTKMNDILLVHVFYRFTYLAHVVYDLSLGHRVTLGGYSLEQFTTGQAVEAKR